METRTAEAWVQFFAISLLITGATSLFVAAIQLLFSPFSPPDEIGKAGMIMLNIVGAIFSGGFAVLYLFFGAGLWRRKPWARIVMLVFAWLGVAVGAIIVLLGGIFGGMSVMLPELAAVGPYLTAIFVLLGLCIVAICAFEVWLFMNATTASLFTVDEGTLMPSLEGMHEPTVRAWGIYSMITAIGFAIVGIALAVFGPMLIELLPSDVLVPQWVSQALALGGILLAVLGVAMAFIGLGLWRFQEWARIATLVLAWITAFAMLLIAVMLIAISPNVFDAATLGAQVVAYVLVTGVEIWFFMHERTRQLFSLTGHSRAAVKRQ